MSRTLVCVNVLHSVNSEVYGSHCQEWFRLGRDSPDDFVMYHPQRLSIDNARNQAANFAIGTSCDYLYFIDDDMILSPKTYQSLKACNADVAQALTFIRGYPFDPMCFRYIEGQSKLDYFFDYEDHMDEDGVVPCDAVGFACALIKVETMLKINQPYFVTGIGTTEDVYFCIKLKEQLGDAANIVVDTKVPTGHFLHPEAVSVYNREALMEYHRAIDKNKRISDLARDRGNKYLEAVKGQFEEPKAW